MKAKKIIPCMDIRGGKIVKGVNFENIREIADPVEMAAYYSASGADELVFYDITASAEGRSVFDDLLSRVIREINIPLMVGGGIAAIEDCERVFALGGAKVSINSGAIKNPDLIAKAAGKYGSACVALSMDVKKIGADYRVFSSGGMADTGICALEWAHRGQENGAGELVINSIAGDGARTGFDLEMLLAIRSVSHLPIVASGGAGKKEDFLELFTKTDIEAGLAASIFHLKEVQIPDLKEYLSSNGIAVCN